MTKKLKISEDLSLPVDIVTQKLGWLGVTGGGKTYAAQLLAELMWDAGAQIVALDPVGVWYGLRLAADGRRPSDITIPIFGGLHGDLPLEYTAGAFMADLIVDKGISAVLDVSQFESDAQKARFGADFADRFFFRKKGAPSAVHLFIEESQEFVPQNTMKGEERMLHAFTRLQKLGRNFGVGSSFITQRPQEVNKKALNMAQTLFVFRVTGPQERKTIDGWIAEKGLDQNIAGDLPKLKTGTCHVWSPEFLGISEIVKISQKRTFNASATPEVGAVASARHLAPIDVAKIRTDMAATIERAKADDPRELRKRIAELEREAKKAPASSAPASMSDRDLERLKAQTRRERDTEWGAVNRERDAFIVDLKRRQGKIARSVEKAHAALEEIATELGREMPKLSAVPAIEELPVAPRREAPVVQRAASRPSSGNGKDHGDVAPVQQRILNALAELEQLGAREPDRIQVAFLAGYSHLQSTGFVKALGALRTAELIDYPKSGTVVLTDGGRSQAQYPEKPRSPKEVRDRVVSLLGGVHERVLQPLLDAYPKAIPREEVARKAGYTHLQSTGFVKALGRLRSLGFVDYPSTGTVAAQPVLFLEESRR